MITVEVIVMIGVAWGILLLFAWSFVRFELTDRDPVLKQNKDWYR
jgi:hypothetical protein